MVSQLERPPREHQLPLIPAAGRPTGVQALQAALQQLVGVVIGAACWEGGRVRVGRLSGSGMKLARRRCRRRRLGSAPAPGRLLGLRWLSGGLEQAPVRGRARTGWPGRRRCRAPRTGRRRGAGRCVPWLLGCGRAAELQWSRRERRNGLHASRCAAKHGSWRPWTVLRQQAGVLRTTHRRWAVLHYLGHRAAAAGAPTRNSFSWPRGPAPFTRHSASDRLTSL